MTRNPSNLIPLTGQAEQTHIKVVPPDSGIAGGVSELTALVVLTAGCGFILREVIRGWSKWMEASVHSAAENQRMIIENSKRDQELLSAVFIQQNDRVVAAIEKQTDTISVLNQRIENFMHIVWSNKKSLVEKTDDRNQESA